MEERSGGSDTDSEIMRLRERKEELEKARRTEAARARRAQREILNEVGMLIIWKDWKEDYLDGLELELFVLIIIFPQGCECQSTYQTTDPRSRHKHTGQFLKMTTQLIKSQVDHMVIALPSGWTAQSLCFRLTTWQR